jgi:hypothetical protein
MRFETAKGTCGPVSLYNVLLALGERPSLKKIRQDCGTNPEEGTQPHGLKQAVERAGRSHLDLSAGFDDGYDALHAHLVGGGGAILLTEAGDHWEAAIGVLGPRVIIFNADRLQNPDNRQANGVNVLTKRQLRAHWDAFEGKRYALLVA